MLRHTFVTTTLDAGVDLRDVQIAARHADPRTTIRYDRARNNLDRHPNYILAAFMASATKSVRCSACRDAEHRMPRLSRMSPRLRSGKYELDLADLYGRMWDLAADDRGVKSRQVVHDA
jgi:hypothetical protein